jgi:hypothetical protein
VSQRVIHFLKVIDFGQDDSDGSQQPGAILVRISIRIGDQGFASPLQRPKVSGAHVENMNTANAADFKVELALQAPTIWFLQ